MIKKGQVSLQTIKPFLYYNYPQKRVIEIRKDKIEVRIMKEIIIQTPSELQEFSIEKLEETKSIVFRYWQVIDAVITLKKAQNKLETNK